MCSCLLPPNRIQHTLSVLQWFANKYASWFPHCRQFLSVDNREERFIGSSAIAGCLRLIKDLHPGTQCWLLLPFPKWITLACVLYYRSCAPTSSRMHEQHPVDYPMYSPGPRLCRHCMDGFSFPALVVKQLLLGIWQDIQHYKKVLCYPTSTDAPISSATPNAINEISLSSSADAFCTSQPAASRCDARRAMMRTLFVVFL